MVVWMVSLVCCLARQSVIASCSRRCGPNTDLALVASALVFWDVLAPIEEEDNTITPRDALFLTKPRAPFVDAACLQVQTGMQDTAGAAWPWSESSQFGSDAGWRQ